MYLFFHVLHSYLALFLKNHSTFEFNLKIYFSVRSTRDSGKQHRPVSFRFSATCEADIRKYTKEAYACKEKNNTLLLSMAIKLSQRCSSTNIKEVNATFLTASNKQIAIISVCGTISSIFEARKRFDWFLGVTTINVDLAKQEDIKFAHRIPAEEKEHKNLRKATYPWGGCDSIVIWRNRREVDFIYRTKFLYLNRCLKQLW